MFFIRRGTGNLFFDPFHTPIEWKIRPPQDIDWASELQNVIQTVNTLTPQLRNLALYWGTVETTQRINPIIYNLIKKYDLSSPYAARILGCFHAAINDVFILTWIIKYGWDVARPCQYENLPTVVPTPRFPAYPSAHATVAGCAEVILSYFFPQESPGLKTVMEGSAASRLYAGVHFNIDNVEGLSLGRQIGEIIINFLKHQNIKDTL